MKKILFGLLLFSSSFLFAQNVQSTIQVSTDNNNNPLNNSNGNDVSQVEPNIEQQSEQVDHNPFGNVPPQNNIVPQNINYPQQQVQQVPQNTNPGNNYSVNRGSSSSRSSGGSVSMGSGKKHKTGFVKTFGKKIEKVIYKSKGKKKFHPRHKRNKRNIIRCFG